MHWQSLLTPPGLRGARTDRLVNEVPYLTRPLLVNCRWHRLVTSFQKPSFLWTQLWIVLYIGFFFFLQFFKWGERGYGSIPRSLRRMEISLLTSDSHSELSQILTTPPEAGISIVLSFQTSEWQCREVTQLAQDQLVSDKTDSSSVPPAPTVDPNPVLTAVLLAPAGGSQGPAGCGVCFRSLT